MNCSCHLSNLVWFWLLECQESQLCFVTNDNKWRVFALQTSGWTIGAIYSRHAWLIKCFSCKINQISHKCSCSSQETPTTLRKTTNYRLYGLPGVMCISLWIVIITDLVCRHFVQHKHSETSWWFGVSFFSSSANNDAIGCKSLSVRLNVRAVWVTGGCCLHMCCDKARKRRETAHNWNKDLYLSPQAVWQSQKRKRTCWHHVLEALGTRESHLRHLWGKKRHCFFFRSSLN